MFGKPVYNVRELKEAIATFAARAAEKLRRQGCAAGMIDVFVVTNGTKQEKYAYQPRSDHRYLLLPRATSYTDELIVHATTLAEDLFREGVRYQKAGIILGDLVPDHSVQAGLFETGADRGRKDLMEAMDNINFGMRGDLVKYAATGLKRNWSMRQEMRSARYTTRWEELREVH
jgi:DNA polymerase V